MKINRIFGWLSERWAAAVLPHPDAAVPVICRHLAEAEAAILVELWGY